VKFNVDPDHDVTVYGPPFKLEGVAPAIPTSAPGNLNSPDTELTVTLVPVPPVIAVALIVVSPP